ncbi:hypothetical protein [Burkholderia latens]|uniref:hypothetical protein n=1 Tax=Burkholderia latens TaxID=488446 RepID=UPI0014795850|nr:hypothetical protein [Burkholderia latens]
MERECFGNFSVPANALREGLPARLTELFFNFLFAPDAIAEIFPGYVRDECATNIA